MVHVAPVRCICKYVPSPFAKPTARFTREFSSPSAKRSDADTGCVYSSLSTAKITTTRDGLVGVRKHASRRIYVNIPPTFEQVHPIASAIPKRIPHNRQSHARTHIRNALQVNPALLTPIQAAGCAGTTFSGIGAGWHAQFIGRGEICLQHANGAFRKGHANSLSPHCSALRISKILADKTRKLPSTGKGVSTTKFLIPTPAQPHPPRNLQLQQHVLTTYVVLYPPGFSRDAHFFLPPTHPPEAWHTPCRRQA